MCKLAHQAGLYTADPRIDPRAELIREIRCIDADIRRLAGGSGTDTGTGGMATKIEAAEMATRSGTEVVIAAGSESDVLIRLARGNSIGTRFFPTVSHIESRKRWILSGSHARGRIYVDHGAAVAVTTKGKSLLPVGVPDAGEDFDRGETVRIYHGEVEIARGVIRYSSDELALIKGMHSHQIRERLGYDYGDEIVHHNDMVILNTGEGT